MLKKITIIVLSIILLMMMAQSFIGLFKWNIEFGEPQMKRVKITHVKTIERTIRAGNRVGMSANVGSYHNWFATVQFRDGRTSGVNVAYGPVPKVGNCMPVIATELSNGNIVALLNVDEWRFGTEYGNCD